MGVSGQLLTSRIYVWVDRHQIGYRMGVNKGGHRNDEDKESPSVVSEVRWRYPVPGKYDDCSGQGWSLESTHLACVRCEVTKAYKK